MDRPAGSGDAEGDLVEWLPRQETERQIRGCVEPGEFLAFFGHAPGNPRADGIEQMNRKPLSDGFLQLSAAACAGDPLAHLFENAHCGSCAPFKSKPRP